MNGSSPTINERQVIDTITSNDDNIKIFQNPENNDKWIMFDPDTTYVGIFDTSRLAIDVVEQRGFLSAYLFVPHDKQLSLCILRKPSIN